jgi:hypothetical protein
VDGIEFDALERSKNKAKQLKGSLSRELLRAIAFRIEEVYPEATRAHVIMYPDNVYRVWALSAGKRWVTVCEDDVAPTWTSINLDQDIDLLIRLGWSPRIHTYTRADGIETHSLTLRTWEAEQERKHHGDHRAHHVAQGKVPGVQDDEPLQGRQQHLRVEVASPQEEPAADARVRDGDGHQRTR